jgi:hypothetical protein
MFIKTGPWDHVPQQFKNLLMHKIHKHEHKVTVRHSCTSKTQTQTQTQCAASTSHVILGDGPCRLRSWWHLLCAYATSVRHCEHLPWHDTIKALFLVHTFYRIYNTSKLAELCLSLGYKCSTICCSLESDRSICTHAHHTHARAHSACSTSQGSNILYRAPPSSECNSKFLVQEINWDGALR